ncbi:MAG: hypothetical protein GF308_06260 [Candidatus Heimdallarchaeota archaeon]|nr:hypothetical protein [Candidatus Heimdallarchaeota archaeon]
MKNSNHPQTCFLTLVFLLLVFQPIIIIAANCQNNIHSISSNDLSSEKDSNNILLRKETNDFSLSTNYSHPLSKDTLFMLPGDEIVLLGGGNVKKPNCTDSCEISGVILDDEDSSFDTMDFLYESFGNYPEVVTGNIDTSYNYEIICSGRSVSTRIYNITKHENNSTEVTEMHEIPDEGQWAVTAGDVDGDGLDEIILYGELLTIYDDALADFALLYQTSDFYIQDLYYDDLLFQEVVCGNIDNDENEEIALAIKWTKDSGMVTDYTSYIWILDHDYSELKEYTKETENDDHNLDITFGDLDDDHIDEFVYLLGDLYIVDDKNTNFDQIKTISSYSTSGGTYPIDFSHTGKLACGNLDDDYKEDIVFQNIWSDELNLAVFNSGNNFEIEKHFILDSSMDEDYYHHALTIGNLDSDAQEELAVSYYFYPQGGSGELRFKSIDDKLENWAIIEEKIYDYQDIEYHQPAIFSGDFDHDGITLKYTGIHNQSISTPRIFTVLAAPPTITGVDQNFALSGTMYGTGVENSETSSNGYSISHGLSVTVKKQLFPFDLLNIHATTTLNWEFEQTNAHTSTITTSTEYTTDYQDNYVIFETVLYDQFYYEFISHRNESLIGSQMAINLPGTASIYKWTVNYFNENNGDFPDIGNETFTHTVGQAWTYPTTNQKNTLLTENQENGGTWSDTTKHPVGQGGGTISTRVDLQEIEETTQERTFSVGWSAGFEAFQEKLDISYVGEKSWSSAYTVSFGENTAYQGTVGDIGKKYYEDYSYSFGLFVYTIVREDEGAEGLTYQVINYWVEDYYGPLENPTGPIGVPFISTLWIFLAVSLFTAITTLTLHRKSSK